MKKEIIFILSILFSLSFFAQENQQSFTLQEAIDYALENNRQKMLLEILKQQNNKNGKLLLLVCRK